MTHSKAPWRTEASCWGGEIVIRDTEGNEVARTPDFQECYKKEEEANARLIAAAPKLLEALELAKEHLDDLTTLYAPEFCREESVKAAQERMKEGGRLWVSATVLQTITEALKEATNAD